MTGTRGKLARLKHEADPLHEVAARIAKRWRLVCFDEFHVGDIADAMILGRLFSALFAHGGVFVLTSNYPPDGLWPNGLQRERFLPAIALLKEWLDVIEVDAGIDYRLRALEQARTYHVPLGPAAEAELAAAFERMRSGPDGDAQLTIEGRTLTPRKGAGSALVRLLRPVRRPPGPPRLSGACPDLPGALPVRGAADERGDGGSAFSMNLILTA